ncbi:MAG: 3-phosphoshikimate 1-carboxyvinyltransferase [Bifidobacteriaceae bacterium]|jgi:3-phosphoshikimate 1-carboxyvinyltransferase|nr:3-phosphoshikimate 1-carboxyvinyltransferase [Bifidobacteriaceae bacterium]
MWLDPWPAPRPAAQIDATVHVPGSKSLTARYLVLAALADSPSVLTGALASRDTTLMISALRQLGAHIDHEDAEGDRLRVRPAPPTGQAHVDVGLAGTVMRFVPPIAALARQPVVFDGDPAARRRPMAPLIDALRALGVPVEDEGRGHLPFTVRGTGAVARHEVEVDASASSQFLSALLLAAPALGGLEVSVAGPVPSRPHVEMTLAALRDFGAEVEDVSGGDPAGIRSRPRPRPDRSGMVGDPSRVPARMRLHVGGRLHGRTMAIEPDLSGAAPFLAAGLVAGGRVTVADWPAITTQPGRFLPEYLAAFGAHVTWSPAGLTVAGSQRPHGANLDLAPAGELAPTLAAIATVADGPSRLSGIGHLRGHETDRLAALTREINRVGAHARELADGLEITPGPLRAAVAETYGDHRMATFAAVVGLAVEGMRIRDIATTSKTMPDFPDRWRAMVEAPQ